MKAMLTAFVAAGLIALGANVILTNAGFGSDEQTMSSAVRLE